MQGADRCFDHDIGQGDFEAIGLQLFNLRRPLVDNRNVVTGFGEIGADAAADGPCAQNRDFFLQAGGKQYEYIPALNASAAHIEALGQIISEQLQGWPEASKAWSAEAVAAQEKHQHDGWQYGKG